MHASERLAGQMLAGEGASNVGSVAGFNSAASISRWASSSAQSTQ